MSSQNKARTAAVFLLAAAVFMFLGWITNNYLAAFLAALSAWLFWHATNVLLLRRRLNRSSGSTPPGIGIWADIFDRIDTLENRNERHEERYTAMVGDFQVLAEAFPDAAMLVDEQGRLRWFNSAARTAFSLEDSKHIRRHAARWIQIPAFQEWMERSESQQVQFRLKAHGGSESWMEGDSIPLRDGKRLIILRDITDFRNIERLRRDFVTNVSHELRTPLTVMLGYLETLLDRQPEDITEPVQRMHAQAVQMQGMLNDFLELSRIQSFEIDGEDERVDVPGILAQLLEQAEEISRGNHQIDFEVDNKLCLLGSGPDLESAFRNLIVNALKYTPEGGKISVHWSRSPDGPVLEVRDTGIGIPTREIPRLTERFYRIGSDRGRKTGGTGLGLAIVKHVLNAHEAKLAIESEYGVGSRFCCIFPENRIRN
jgi:two-component system phosphate regulon sensor histidine kinase PhoR